MRRSVTHILSIACTTLVFSGTGQGGEAAGVTDETKDCSRGGEQEMVACVAAAYEASDLELNKLYKQLKEQGSPEDQRKLVIAQRAWIKRRDATCASDVASHYEGSDAQYGTSQLLYSGQMNDCLMRITLRRVKALKTELRKRGNK
jgi:uncharacterized protein YecT (DUF1311 family)